MALKKVSWKDVGCNKLLRGRNEGQACVNTVLHIPAPENVGIP